MALSINNNISALSNQRELKKSNDLLQSTFEKLASGKRINKASDDAAGLAIATALATEESTIGVASRNISDAVSQISIADSALQSSSDITIRLSELSTQAANGTLSDTQRQSLDQEFQALRGELDRISSTTEFNGQQVLGSSVTIQSGTGSDANSQTEVTVGDVSSASLGIDTLSIATQAGAQAATETLSQATETIAAERASLGAAESRLESNFSQLQGLRVANAEARSRIEDADIASVSANNISAQIKVRAGVAVGAQANFQPDLVQKLLSS